MLTGSGKAFSAGGDLDWIAQHAPLVPMHVGSVLDEALDHPTARPKPYRDPLEWLLLMKEELGNEWLTPERFRFGASALLGDIERQLEHFATGRYSALHRHPMA